MIVRGPNFQQFPLNIVGSSTFGRYAKISTEKTVNMFISDNALVPYTGYKVAVPSSEFNSQEGRAIFSSVKFNRLVVVQGSNVFLVSINYDQQFDTITSYSVSNIGTLNTNTGVVYIAENNKPQIGISDGTNFYIYDPSLSPVIQVVTDLDFVPGYLTFHRSYFILATPNQTWRLSLENEGYKNPLTNSTAWPNSAAYVGSIQTKSDNVQAVIRFPSKGNMILIMGKVATEAWFNTGAQLFPYQRNNQMDIDYGCVNPATVAAMDEMVVWLARNEASGPIILATTGGAPQKITTDGIDYLFSTLQAPEDSRAFLYRQDGHLFYHINFYTDNLSLFYDFNTQKFFNAADENGNYFIANGVAFYGNQYYCISNNNGNIFALDTTITTYDYENSEGSIEVRQIPRSRICYNIRDQEQDYKIINDIGFTIESGNTNYVQQNVNGVLSQSGEHSLPRVDLSISTDGGATFGTTWGQSLPPVGYRKNKLIFWVGSAANDLVCKVDFWSFGRIVALDGIVNVRF